MSPQNSPLHRMSSIVSTCDRLADDPQALGLFLHLRGIDHGMVTSYRNAIRDAEARTRRPRPTPSGDRRTMLRTCCAVMSTVRHSR